MRQNGGSENEMRERNLSSILIVVLWGMGGGGRNLCFILCWCKGKGCQFV